MRLKIAAGLYLAGLALIVVAAWMMWLPLGLCVLGASLALLSVAVREGYQQ